VTHGIDRRGAPSGSRLYLVAPARLAAGWLADLVAELADAGVGLVQLREKDKEAGEVMRLGAPVAAACAAAGVGFIVNDRPDVALGLGADGVHLGQDDVPTWVARGILGDAVVGRSTHSKAQLDAELRSETRPDYVAVGPIYATPTKPGRPAVGLDLVRHAARVATLPWFAIGGIDATTLPEVAAAGARRVVVVRAITEARRPASAARALREILDAARAKPAG
jgi:thiamine-phosphate pyrophosphorylase